MRNIREHTGRQMTLPYGVFVYQYLKRKKRWKINRQTAEFANNLQQSHTGQNQAIFSSNELQRMHVFL
jgi:hypothetical protein